MRRFLAPLICALVAAACAVGVAATTGATASDATSHGPHIVTPVLSARRVPVALESLAADATLRTKLDGVVARSLPATCLVVEDQGRTLYTHAGEQPLLPASNEKLATATAALQVLGPSDRLTTTIRATSRPGPGGAIHGDLYLIGGGDPLLATDDYRRTRLDPKLSTSLERLADQIVDAGIRRIDGRVVGDESRYDNQRTVASWPPNYTAEHQSGPLSALTVNDGWASFPSRTAPTAQLQPAPDPAKMAADRLSLLLQQRGVIVAGGTASGPTPAGVPEITHLDSLPLSDIVREMLSESDNQTAELVLKELGHSAGSGSTAAGLRVVHQALDKLGIPQSGTTQVDGSGLDRGNRVTCDFLVHLLDKAGPSSPLAAGLPVAAESGTLKGRYVRTPAAGRLRAKTGTLEDVSALAGFVKTARGETLTFAYLTNGKPKTLAQAGAEAELGPDLVAYPQGVDVKAIGPAPVG